MWVCLCCFRNPCSSKTDADLPRYGKKWTYVPNIPAVVSEEKDCDSFVSMVPGEVVVVVTEGENGEQILTQAQVVSNNETVSSLSETLVSVFFVFVLFVCCGSELVNLYFA